MVTFDSEAVKWDVIRAAPDIQYSSSYGNIFINPDLTRTEREAAKLLRDELKARRGNGERNLAIRNGKIVMVPGSDSRRQRRAQNWAGQAPAATTVAAGQPSTTHARSAGLSREPGIFGHAAGRDPLGGAAAPAADQAATNNNLGTGDGLVAPAPAVAPASAPTSASAGPGQPPQGSSTQQ